MPDCTDMFSSFFLNEVIESLDRIESGKLCQTLGATTPKALAPVAALVYFILVENPASFGLLSNPHNNFIILVSSNP